MKIQGSSTGAVSSLRRAGSISGSAGSARTPSAGGRPADAVQISALGSELSAGTTHLSGYATAKAVRVAELTSSVATGRYTVDAMGVSDKLIEEHLAAAA